MIKTLKNDEIKLKVVELDAQGLSGRSIAKELGLKRSSIGYFLRKESHTDWWQKMDEEKEPAGDDAFKYTQNTEPTIKLKGSTSTEPVRVITSTEFIDNCTHLMIGDTQVRPGLDMSWLSRIGNYLVDIKPDVIIMIGDHFDLPSLSSYDKGTKKAEGKHLWNDIEAGIQGMNRILQPLADLQSEEYRLYGEVRYKPRMIFTLGNHEERLARHINANPELTGFVSYADFKLEENGFQVFDFLQPAVVNGITYIHYLPNPMTGRAMGGQASTMLKNSGCSVSMGHQQKLDVATRNLPTGEMQWFLICGSTYEHDEGYKGYCGNKHFRGLVVKRCVNNGSYEPMFVSLEYLKKRYTEKQ